MKVKQGEGRDELRLCSFLVLWLSGKYIELQGIEWFNSTVYIVCSRRSRHGIIIPSAVIKGIPGTSRVAYWSTRLTILYTGTGKHIPGFELFYLGAARVGYYVIWVPLMGKAVFSWSLRIFLWPASSGMERVYVEGCSGETNASCFAWLSVEGREGWWGGREEGEVG